MVQDDLFSSYPVLYRQTTISKGNDEKQQYEHQPKAAYIQHSWEA